MVKKGKKKQGAGKAKTEAKAAKKSQKAAKRARAADGEDVEAILAEIMAKEAEALEVAEVQEVDPPSPRTAFTIIANPIDENQIVMFGGERYTGEKANFFSELYVYNVQKCAWTRYDSPNRPPPRSSHAAAVHRNFMYIFGGEFSNPSLSQYRHYRDLWRLDLEEMSWERVEIRGGPTARSGHRMCVANNKLIVFGGFFDTGFDNKYLNDLYYVDLSQDELKWTKVETSAVDVVPSPRSGFQWITYGDDVIMYGGYCKEALKKAKNVSHKGKKKGGNAAVEESMVAQGVVLSDMYKLSAANMKWSKMKRAGYGPSRRAGFSMVLHKTNAVVFGGVEDDETEEQMESVFYNDLFAMNIEKKKWYPMTLRRKKTKKAKRRKTEQNNTSAERGSSSTGAELTSGDATMVDVADVKEGEEEDDKELDTDALEAALLAEQEEAMPCARFNAAVAVQKNIMYIVGGVIEKGQSEVTLDDIWAIDLNKLDEYKELKKLSSECIEWMESDGDEDEDGEDESASEDGGDSSDADKMEDEDEDGDKSEKEQRRFGRRDRLRARVQEGGSEQFTPLVNESLKDFFERTKPYWIGEVHEALGESGKALRRVSFEWAFRRYWEIKPTLKELEELELQLAREEVLEQEFEKASLEQKRGRSRR